MWAITFQSVFLTRVTPYPGSGANTSFFRVFPQPPENGYCVWSPLVLNLPKVGMRDSLMPYDSCDDLFHNLSLAELLKTYRDEPRVETRFFSSVFFLWIQYKADRDYLTYLLNLIRSFRAYSAFRLSSIIASSPRIYQKRHNTRGILEYIFAR